MFFHVLMKQLNIKLNWVTINLFMPQEKGNITIVNNLDEKKDIHDGYYVHSLKHNLLSIGEISENGFEFKFKGPKYTIIDKPLS